VPWHLWVPRNLFSISSVRLMAVIFCKQPKRKLRAGGLNQRSETRLADARPFFSGGAQAKSDLRSGSPAPDGLGKTFDLFDLYANSVFRMPPELIASFLGREVTFLATELPAWMNEALGQAAYLTVKVSEFFERGKPLPAIFHSHRMRNSI
jgi:hypothetical protein